MTRCNCGASCGENRYHEYGSIGCQYRAKQQTVDIVPVIREELDNLRRFNREMRDLLQKIVDHSLQDPFNQSTLFGNALSAKKLLVEQEIGEFR